MKPVTTLKEARRAVKLGSTPVKHDFVLDPDSVGQTIVEDNFYHFQEFANSRKFDPKNKIYNKSMLDFAAECGSFQIFDWLLQRETKVTDNTCICALRGGNIEIIKLCRRTSKFDFGAYINVAVNYRMNDAVDWIIKNYPLHEQISIWDAAQADNIEAVFYCISHGVPVDAVDFQGWTPLHRACQYGQEESCKFLIKKGASIAARNLQQCTPFHNACFYGHKKVAKFLLKRGSYIEEMDGDKNTSLILAAKKGHEEVVELLIKSGANVDAKNKEGSTALHMAVKYGHEMCARVLLKKGNAKADVRNNDGATPLSIAKKAGNERLVALLVEHGA